MKNVIRRLAKATSGCLLILIAYAGLTWNVFAAASEVTPYKIYVVGEDRSDTVLKLTLAGHNVIYEPDVTAINTVDLSSYDQVWFVDSQNVPGPSGRANLLNFVRSGGKLFFMGDSYKDYRAALISWRDSLFNELGAGGIKQSQDINPTQTIYYTNPYHSTSYSPHEVHFIEHGPGRNGSFEGTGNGMVIVGAGMYASGNAVAIAFDYGALTKAINARAVVYLNSNNVTNWDLYAANLAYFLGSKERAIFSVKASKGLPGYTGRVKIELQNSKAVSGIQFTMADIPDLLTTSQITTTNRSMNFSIEFSEDTTGALKVIISSESGATILPGTGPIAEVIYNVSQNAVAGDSSQLLLSDVMLSNIYGESLPVTAIDGVFRYGVLKGDVVMDGKIDVLDLVRIIDIILGRPPTPTELELEAADYNSDEMINILDVVGIINEILGIRPSGSLPKVKPTAKFYSPANALLEGNPTEIPFFITCSQSITALQMKISYDVEKVEIGRPQTSPRTTNMTLSSHNQDGKLILLLFSSRGEKVDPGEGPVLSLPVEIKSGLTEESVIKVDEIILVGGDGQVIPVNLTEVMEIGEFLPRTFSLSQNYPNPFNSGTEIRYQLPESAQVRLGIYNLLGQEIRTLVNEKKEAGFYSTHWDGRDQNGAFVASGVYIYRIQMGDFMSTRKLTLLK